MEIVWSERPLARLVEIREFAADKPDAASRLATRIVSIVATLAIRPHLGRTGAVPGLREIVIGGTPYIVVYRVGRKRVTILTVWHAAQRRKR